MDNGDKIKMHERMASLETEMGYIKEEVTNHLPSQIKDLDTKVTKKLNWGIMLLIATLIGIIANFVK